MKRRLLITGAVLALGSSVLGGLAYAAPESLLPPGFGNNRPAPTPAARPAAPPPQSGPAQSNRPAPTIQPVPVLGIGTPAGDAPSNVTLPANFPSLKELGDMDADEIDQLFGLKPKFDIPAAARRETAQVGVLAENETGLPLASLASQPASLVRAILAGTKQPLVSRWGHILLRRALASRLDAPQGMDPVEFAALRAALLNRMGEPVVARALVQDIDSDKYTTPLANAAFDAYLGTGDLTGICPVARLKSELREDAQWDMAKAICAAYAGNNNSANRELDRAFSRRTGPGIDVLLAQRYAGAAAEGGRAVNIEWTEIDTLDPWRFSLATALGIEIPDALRAKAGTRFDRWAAVSPSLSLSARAQAADTAGGAGVLSSAAMVDLYAQIWSDEGITGEWHDRAEQLREAYVAANSAARMSAIRGLWGNGEDVYGRHVLTAYAAARIAPSEQLSDDAAPLIGSMLAAGLDRNAMRWGAVVAEGTEGWGLLAIAQPRRQSEVDSGAVSDFIDADSSADKRKSQFLAAGLAGLGRLDAGTAQDFVNQLGGRLGGQTRWSQAIDRAAELGNPTLVVLLVGLGMQGDSWERMTPRHLFHIVRGLNRVGLEAEARMIAAEAVSRA
jgi:hypothetical protein